MEYVNHCSLNISMYQMEYSPYFIHEKNILKIGEIIWQDPNLTSAKLGLYPTLLVLTMCSALFSLGALQG